LTSFIVNDPQDPTINRIFAYMAIISCLITTEVVRSQEKIYKEMLPDAQCELDEKYRMCSS
jgi:hypothetical protein